MPFLIKLARTIGFILLGLVFIAAPMAAYKFGVLPPLQTALGLTKPSPFVSPPGMLVAMALGYWAFVRIVERRPASELSLRPAQALLGITLGITLIGVPILILYGLGNYQLLAYQGFGNMPGVVPTIIAAAVLEELIFRALIFSALNRAFGFVAALVLQSVLFAGLHLFNEGFGGWIDLVAGILIGGFWTCLYALWRNVWSIGLHHAAWNLTIVVTGLPLSGLSEFRPLAPFKSIFQGSTLMSGGDGGPEPSLVTLALTLVTLAIAFMLVQRHGKAAASAANS